MSIETKLTYSTVQRLYSISESVCSAALQYLRVCLFSGSTVSQSPYCSAALQYLRVRTVQRLYSISESVLFSGSTVSESPYCSGAQQYLSLRVCGISESVLFERLYSIATQAPMFESLVYRGFPTRRVYLHYISCLRYTILVGNPRYDPTPPQAPRGKRGSNSGLLLPRRTSYHRANEAVIRMIEVPPTEWSIETKRT